MAKVNDGYDLGSAFRAIENELISSMMRNLSRHRAEEDDTGLNWSMWQAVQLEALEKYKASHQKKYGKRFAEINQKIEQLLRSMKETGGTEQEQEILRAIKDGLPERLSQGMQGEFFRVNDRKLDTLVRATLTDMEKAETAVLRMANDQYRKIIFNAQVYANTGAGTYEKAVDMATKDFLAAGLNCIEYKNGARHTLSDYADMAIRTAGKRAYLQGEGEKRKEWGLTLVIINKRGNPCPKCLPFVGKVMIDDVWSGGKKEDGPYPLMSAAIASGLYHPRCKDSHTTYFPGITTADDKWTKEELQAVERESKAEARQQYAQRQAEKFGRLTEYSLDPENKRKYGARAKEWRGVRFRTGDLDSHSYAESKRPLGNFRATPQNQVVNILRQDSEGWLQKLTDEEKRAIQKYTYNSGDNKPSRFFERLNAMLRGDLPEDEKLRRYADTISSAIRKQKLKRDVIVYRGSNFDPAEGHKIGEIIVPGQFFSTSVIDSRSFKTKYKIVIYVKKGSNAAYIETLSRFPGQRELLIDKDCYYRVLSRKDDVVELEVL